MMRHGGSFSCLSVPGSTCGNARLAESPGYSLCGAPLKYHKPTGSLHMNMKCEEHLEDLVAAAFGETTEKLTRHLVNCEGCQERLRQFTVLATGLQAGHHNAPADLLRAAQEIQLPNAARRGVMARLTASSLAFSGARLAEADSFQLLFEAEGDQVRMMYARSGKEWEVSGQAPAGRSIHHGATEVASDAAGRFRFRVDALDSTAIRIGGLDTDILVPAASEVSGGAPGSAS